jgi:hypothetical protein
MDDPRRPAGQSVHERAPLLELHDKTFDAHDRVGWRWQAHG